MKHRILTSLIGVCMLITPALSEECDAPAAINAIKERIVCGELARCSFYGLSYQQLLAIPQAELRERVAKSLPPDPIAGRLADLTANMAVDAREAIEDIKAVPVDYKPAIKRYECRALVRFNSNKLQSVIHAGAFMKFFGNQDATMLWLVNRPYAEALFDGWFKEHYLRLGDRMTVSYGVVNGVVEIVDVSDIIR